RDCAVTRKIPEPGAGSFCWGEGGRVRAPRHGGRVRGSKSGTRSYTAYWERDRAVPHEADGLAERFEPAGKGLTSLEVAVSHCITPVTDSFLYSD
ncbi:hypothetical protein XELAEV_18047118mg, partial [Xenopus laevis]